MFGICVTLSVTSLPILVEEFQGRAKNASSGISVTLSVTSLPIAARETSVHTWVGDAPGFVTRSGSVKKTVPLGFAVP